MAVLSIILLLVNGAGYWFNSLMLAFPAIVLLLEELTAPFITYTP